MAERRPGKLFRVMLIVFLAGIFFELFAIIGILGDDRLDKGNIAVVDLRR
jgi:ABC-type microcin C transport system permease subunit YejB